MKLSELLEADINKASTKTQIEALVDNPDLYELINKPSPAVKSAMIILHPWSVGQYDGLTDDEIIKALTNNTIIKKYPDEYNEFIQEYFKDNALLMNKWLRYAKNVIGGT